MMRDALPPIPFQNQHIMMLTDANVESVHLYPNPGTFGNSSTASPLLVDLNIKAAVFDLVLFVFLNNICNRVKVLY